MAGEKSFLQTIKMEISRSFRLVPYERIAFHKILSILKTESGRNILLKELTKSEDIRTSAIETLASFDDQGVTDKLAEMLGGKISDKEAVLVLECLAERGSEKHHQAVTDYIEKNKSGTQSPHVVRKAFEVLRKTGASSESVRDYLLSFIKGEGVSDMLVPMAINALSSFPVISPYEPLLKQNDEKIIQAAYNALFNLGCNLSDMAKKAESDPEGLYTYSPENEDKSILDIRVLLGKMAPRFDNYPRNIKVAFISAMISCNHREFLVYVMKALTSRDQELIKMVLFTIYANIKTLKDPDKLLRSLIALSTEKEHENELIIDIFVKYFSQDIKTRHFNILRDKLYNYIIVTLESYFETYRKDFMIPQVIEKSYPETFQRIRKFILENFTPEIKKNIVSFLLNEKPSALKGVFIDIAKWITYISDAEKEDLELTLQILYDGDKKSRENSAARIDDIHFEKRYLRNRIIRLCRIIEGLNINEAASTLVNIYNYLKKYPDPEILSASIHALSMLNYSYMLGEVEVMLTTGSPEERLASLDLLSLFHEQRSMNIIIDYLQQRADEVSPEVKALLGILLERDISGNVTINRILKKIVETNKDQEMRRLAILGIGKSGFDTDIDFLNDLFLKFEKNEPKDAIAQAMGSIVSINADVNKRTLVKYLQEYLKDPGIKVRIYACLLLVKLGDRDAIRSIRDMLIIKNRVIQRDILTIMGELRSVEFAFFLLSLLKDEYGLSGDIIPVIEKLPEEDLKEIDNFVVNIFRKFETPDIEILGQPKETHDAPLPKKEVTLASIELYKLKSDAEYTLTERISLNMMLKGLISSIIEKNHGAISQISNRKITAYFTHPDGAVRTALAISENIREYNLTRISELQINVQAFVATVKAVIVNEEIIQLPEDVLCGVSWLPFSCDVYCNTRASSLLRDNYTMIMIPENMHVDRCFLSPVYDVIRPVNFTETAEKILEKLIRDEEEKAKLQMQVETEMKRMRRESRPASAISIAGDLEDIGDRLKTQLEEIERYIQRRSTDREMIKNVRRMLKNAHDLYKVEISRIIIE